MKTAEEILNKLGIKVSLGSWKDDEGYHAICYTRKQGNTWVAMLQEAGYKAKVVYDTYAYIVVFKEEK